ncbi:MAG: DNA primase [Ardenticatenaceae bacterium]
MASDQVIAEIKARLDIVDYIGRTVDLKQAGQTYKASCPFHVEKTPSFFVFPHTNTWHCFGSCGEGGDIFSFAQKRDGLTFREALLLLAEESGVRLEKESEEQREQWAEQERLLALCEAATTVFQKWLRERPDATHCREYIKARGLSAQSIHRFGLGYAPKSWDSLLNLLTTRGYDPKDMVLVGLARERTGAHQESYYDALRDRLVFPIRDLRGRVIGFGGRVLHNEDFPKYINSPQSTLFDKGRHLYGLDLAKDAIRLAGRAVIVEGYMDVIAAHQAGFTNVVASLGTALTTHQIRLLTRYSPNLTLALDADTAGQKAAERGLERILALQKEMRQARWQRARRGQGPASHVEGDIRLLTLPEGYDPDDLISEAPEQWAQLVEEALPVIDYLIAQRLRNANLDDPLEKARIAADLLPHIADLESVLLRDHYLQRLARLLKTNERVLAEEMLKYSKQARPPRQEGVGANPSGRPTREEGAGAKPGARPTQQEGAAAKSGARPTQEEGVEGSPSGHPTQEEGVEASPGGHPTEEFEEPVMWAEGYVPPEPPPEAPQFWEDLAQSEGQRSDVEETLIDVFYTEPAEIPPPPQPPAPYWDEPPPSEEMDRNEISYSVEEPSHAPPVDEIVQTPSAQSPVPSEREMIEAVKNELGQLEDYLLYLILGRPAFLPEAITYGLRPDMWQQTEFRQIWEALTQHTPETAAHLEEFLDELEAPIQHQVREIIDYYVDEPEIESNEWEFEAFNQLDHFLIRYEERQARQLYYLLDQLERSQETNHQLLNQFGQQIIKIGKRRLVWQRQQKKRSDERQQNF